MPSPARNHPNPPVPHSLSAIAISLPDLTLCDRILSLGPKKPRINLPSSCIAPHVASSLDASGIAPGCVLHNRTAPMPPDAINVHLIPPKLVAALSN
jgi:hypothetical protein